MQEPWPVPDNPERRTAGQNADAFRCRTARSVGATESGGIWDMDRALAMAFVRTHGTALARAHLARLCGDASLVPEARRILAGEQRSDGGWAPPWAPDASSVDATCFRLAQAEQAGLRHDAFVRRATAFLAARQHTDGYVEEDATLAFAAPPWATPGDMQARIYLTANAGYCLNALGGDSGSVTRAVAWLRSRVPADGHLPSFLHAHWLAAGLLHGAGAGDVAARIMTYLDGRLDDLEPSHLAWLLVTLRGAGVAPDAPLLAGAMTRLAARQELDGRWPSEDGPAQDAGVTLEALRALAGYDA